MNKRDIGILGGIGGTALLGALTFGAVQYRNKKKEVAPSKKYFERSKAGIQKFLESEKEVQEFAMKDTVDINAVMDSIKKDFNDTNLVDSFYIDTSYLDTNSRYIVTVTIYADIELGIVVTDNIIIFKPTENFEDLENLFE